MKQKCCLNFCIVLFHIYLLASSSAATSSMSRVLPSKSATSSSPRLNPRWVRAPPTVSSTVMTALTEVDFSEEVNTAFTPLEAPRNRSFLCLDRRGIGKKDATFPSPEKKWLCKWSRVWVVIQWDLWKLWLSILFQRLQLDYNLV